MFKSIKRIKIALIILNIVLLITTSWIPGNIGAVRLQTWFYWIPVYKVPRELIITDIEGVVDQSRGKRKSITQIESIIQKSMPQTKLDLSLIELYADGLDNYAMQLQMNYMVRGEEYLKTLKAYDTDGTEIDLNALRLKEQPKEIWVDTDYNEYENIRLLDRGIIEGNLHRIENGKENRIYKLQSSRINADGIKNASITHSASTSVSVLEFAITRFMSIGSEGWAFTLDNSNRIQGIVKISVKDRNSKLLRFEPFRLITIVNILREHSTNTNPIRIREDGSKLFIYTDTKEIELTGNGTEIRINEPAKIEAAIGINIVDEYSSLENDWYRDLGCNMSVEFNGEQHCEDFYGEKIDILAYYTPTERDIQILRREGIYGHGGTE